MESFEDTDVNKSTSRSVRLILPGEDFPKKSANLWKRALQKLQSVDLDPWLDFPTHDIPVITAVRHRYSVIKKKWVVDEISVKLETVPFDRGAMRECFRLKKLSHRTSRASDWQHASNYVAKRYINEVDRQVYFDDVRLQMEAKLWGEAFNRQNPPKKVDIFQLSVIELRHSGQVEPPHNPDSGGKTQLYHIERYMEGEYRKYNSNSGFVDEQLRNTPQAFSHFTFERSGHRLLVVDIQGVGDLYTDPQIHTSDGVGYSDANLGPKGMAYFFHSHRCNPLCEYLGLTPFDLAPSESVDPSLPITNPEAAVESEANVSAASDVNWDPEKHVDRKAEQAPELYKEKSLKRELRRRSVSFSQPSRAACRFGPTVARSTENVHNNLPQYSRRRCGDSVSVFSDVLPSNLSDENTLDNFSSLNLLDDEPLNTPSIVKLNGERHLNDVTEKTPACFRLRGLVNSHSAIISTESYPKSLLASEVFGRVRPVRDRIASGDSGYSGLMNFRTSSALGHCENPALFTHSMAADLVGNLFNGSTSSLTDLFSRTSPNPVSSGISGTAPHSTVSATDEDFGVSMSLAHQNSMDWYSPTSYRFGGIFPRRPRNMSESSDLDAEEDRRVAGNLLHQLMHESHRPSCAGHPSNLDQEIGQSVLGQIHHELARLHEAGKFLPTCKGGWSQAGLGGLLLKSDAALVAESDVNGCDGTCSSLSFVDQKIDWEAVLFHERHAAQLGCLEAMIVMAHYYLGLPTQLLLDCPIKPVQTDLRSGVDYLWRAAEGGDRRCMILLARYLDVTATISKLPDKSTSGYSRDFLFLPMLHTMSLEMLPSISPDSWAEAVTWYQKAVDTACSMPNGLTDEGLDAEGGYDAAEDLLPVYRILGRMAEMYSVGGFGLKQDFNRAGDLFNRAGELALAAFQGQLATKYFDLGEEAYSMIQ